MKSERKQAYVIEVSCTIYIPVVLLQKKSHIAIYAVLL